MPCHQFELVALPHAGPKQFKLHPLVGDLDPVRGNYTPEVYQGDSKRASVACVHVQAEAADAYAEVATLQVRMLSVRCGAQP